MKKGISSQDVKRELRYLDKKMPYQGYSVYLFARYIADRLPENEVTAIQFYNTATDVLQDLLKGVDRRPIPFYSEGGSIPAQYKNIAGKDLKFYVELNRQTIKIAKVVLPENLVDELSEIQKRARNSPRM